MAKPETAAEVIDLMQQYGTGPNKLKTFKAFVVKKYKETNKIPSANDLLEFAKELFGIKDTNDRQHPLYIRYNYIEQLVKTGTFVPLPPSYADEYDILIKKPNKKVKSNDTG